MSLFTQKEWAEASFRVVKSIADNDTEILQGIMQLHNAGKPFDADVTFSKGTFYQSGAVAMPGMRFDIAPVVKGVKRADCCHLPLANGVLCSIVFDPPFMFNPHGTAKNAAANHGHKSLTRRGIERYTMFETFTKLRTTYQGALAEFRRVLKPGGIIAFKCQDYTDSKTTMTHCLVYQWATEAGFYAKDFFVRYRHNGAAYNKALKQKHARKFHSYWFVFERRK